MMRSELSVRLLSLMVLVALPLFSGAARADPLECKQSRRPQRGSRTCVWCHCGTLLPRPS